MLARTATRAAVKARIAPAGRRLLTTVEKPANKKRTWKGAALRWGLAGAGVYYYNTNDIFAEQENLAIDRLEQSIHNVQRSDLPTIDAIIAEKRARAEQRAAEEALLDQQRAAAAEAAEIATQAAKETAEPVVAAIEEVEGEQTEGSSIEDLEAEAGQQGAFNPETGEINWDCPCLGGMAHGPCGPEFREAFSCFVYSKEEPKGMECIDKFKYVFECYWSADDKLRGMQDCFRAHPEMYGSELEDDEEEVEAEIRAQEDAKAAARGDVSRQEAEFGARSTDSVVSHQPTSAPKETLAAQIPTEPLVADESGDLVSKAIADAVAAEKKN